MQLERISKDFTTPISVYMHVHRIILVKMYMLDLYPSNATGFAYARDRLFEARHVGLRYVHRMKGIDYDGDTSYRRGPLHLPARTRQAHN
jgi:hypothetical protein